MKPCKVCCVVWVVGSTHTMRACAHCGRKFERWLTEDGDLARADHTQRVHGTECIRATRKRIEGVGVIDVRTGVVIHA